MTNVKDLPPNQIFLDLIQDNQDDYIREMGKVLTYSPVPPSQEDQFPAIYSLLDFTETDQRNIPHGKTVLEEVNITVLYYTDNYDNLWNAYQSIKEIIVSNNKVQSTPQFASTGFQWSRVGRTEFDTVYDENRTAMHFFSMSVKTVLQESYN